MTLDLVIRGTGSVRSAEEHLAAVLPECPGSQVLLYGQMAEVPGAMHVSPDPAALAEAVNAAGETALVYGDESLLAQGNALSPTTIWVALGSDANGVREVWRLRQQHGWLTGKKLGLLVEHVDGTPEPDLERMMRLSRAARAVVVLPMAAAASPAPEAPVVLAAEEDANVSGAEEDSPAPAAEPEAAVPTAAAEVAATAPEPEPEVAAPAEEPAAAAEPDVVPAIPVEAAPLTETETEAETTEAVETAIPEVTHHEQTEGAETTMLENNIDHAPETVTPAGATAEQALIQRYALVKERRSTAARIAEVESTMQNLLKELFVSRFAAGPEAAAAFEQVAAKLAEASGEFTQLSKTMARIEAGLAQLAWLKDELEI